MSAEKLAGQEQGYRVATVIAELKREEKAERMAAEVVENFKFTLFLVCVWLLGASFIVEDRSWAMWFFRFVNWSIGTLSFIDLLNITDLRPLDMLHRRLVRTIRALQNWIA